MLALVGVIVFGLWLRYPLVGGGMPYFYSEDEGHHFNRARQHGQGGRSQPSENGGVRLDHRAAV